MARYNTKKLRVTDGWIVRSQSTLRLFINSHGFKPNKEAFMRYVIKSLRKVKVSAINGLNIVNLGSYIF